MKARIKETGEIIFVRTPYEGEYMSSLYERELGQKCLFFR